METSCRVAIEATQDDTLPSRIDIRKGIGSRLDARRGRVAGGTGSDDDLVHDHPQRVNIRRKRSGRSFQLFRSHVRRCSGQKYDTDLRLFHPDVVPRQAKICNDYAFHVGSRRYQHDVGWFQITMNDSGAVRRCKSLGDLENDGHSRLKRQGPFTA